MKIMESRVASEHSIPNIIEKIRAIGKDKVRFVVLYLHIKGYPVNSM
jgi:hypothetical protein